MPVLDRLLPALQVLALVCLGLAGFLLLAETWPGPLEPAYADGAVIDGVVLVAVAVCWVLRARVATGRGRTVLAVITVAVATPVAVTGRVGFTAPVLLLVVALTVLDVSIRAGAVAVAVMGLVGTVLHLLSGNGLLVGLFNAIPVVVLLCFGLALGAALRGQEERRAAEARAAETEKELLLADERARSARELHDGLGHRLTLVSLSLDFAERMRQRDPDAAWTEVTTARTTSQEALTEMRTWVRALSPVRDPSARGAAALEAIAESFRGTGLVVDVTADAAADEALRADPALGLLVYRAVQEGLTNALRHGRARRVRIGVTRRGIPLRLEVVSDLDAHAALSVPVGEAEPGFGLRGLAERVAARGGRMCARREGDDFVLSLEVPV